MQRLPSLGRFSLALVLLLAWGATQWLTEWHERRNSFAPSTFSVTLLVGDEQLFHFPRIEPGTVQDFLTQAGFSLRSEDSIFPPRESKLVPGQTVWYTPARTISIETDHTERKVLTLKATVAEILEDANVPLDTDDLVTPPRAASIADGGIIAVTRVEIRTETTDTPLPFAIQETEDAALSWRQRKTTQKGEKGLRRTTYRVAYHDEHEVSRHLVTTETVKAPIPELVVQGTLVKVGKTHYGAASWYAWTGTLSAANPWLPLGSSVRVTNQENGKSVIVKINDRGPFVPGRIIDLDRVAFQKIASPGAGVIEVKMEEIVN